VYINTPLGSDQFLNFDPDAKDQKCDTGFLPDLLTDEVPSTGWYTMCYGVMQLTSIL
jgi:hypothetical protein